MIDEIETGLHKKYYDTLFPVVFALAKKLNVQLFITTHSIEVIDGILDTQDYEDQDNMDDIKVVTLRKEDDTTLSRVLSGREVFKNREAFGFEVRL